MKYIYVLSVVSDETPESLYGSTGGTPRRARPSMPPPAPPAALSPPPADTPTRYVVVRTNNQSQYKLQNIFLLFFKLNRNSQSAAG